MLQMLSLYLDLEEAWINRNFLELLVNVDTDEATAVLAEIMSALVASLLLGLAHVLFASC